MDQNGLQEDRAKSIIQSIFAENMIQELCRIYQAILRRYWEKENSS